MRIERFDPFAVVAIDLGKGLKIDVLPDDGDFPDILIHEDPLGQRIAQQMIVEPPLIVPLPITELLEAARIDTPAAVDRHGTNQTACRVVVQRPARAVVLQQSVVVGHIDDALRIRCNAPVFIAAAVLFGRQIDYVGMHDNPFRHGACRATEE